MTVDIALGFDIYSPEELQNYASKGLLRAGNVDLTRFVEKILEGMYTQDELDKATEEADESSDKLENLREMVRERLLLFWKGFD